MTERIANEASHPTAGAAKTAVFTIIAKNYLAFARTLMESVAAQHPNFLRFVLFVDETEGFLDPTQEIFTIHRSSALPIPQNRLFHLKYQVLELATAVKPYYMRFLFETYDIAQMIYLDPDIMLFGQLTPVLDALACHPIVLTPHLTAPFVDAGHPNEREIMQAGAYNLGFIAARRARETQALLDWWAKRLYNDCIADVEQNLFVDQRWMDLVPGMFPGVHILRDPGLNVAYWNLPHRPVRTDCGRYTVNGVPLRFFHFSGFDPENAHLLSRHEDRFLSPDSLGDARGVVEIYRSRLLANGYATCTKGPYTHAHFHDGTRIPDLCRQMIRDDLAFQRRLMCLDGVALEDAIIAYTNEPFEGVASDIILTRFADALYRTRPDVRVTFPQVAGAHRLAYAQWFLTDAARDYSLDGVFLRPIAESVERLTGQQFAPSGGPGRAGVLSSIWQALDTERRALAHAVDDARARGAGRETDIGTLWKQGEEP